MNHKKQEKNSSQKEMLYGDKNHNNDYNDNNDNYSCSMNKGHHCFMHLVGLIKCFALIK